MTIGKEYLEALSALLASNPDLPVINNNQVELAREVKFPAVLELVRDGDTYKEDDSDVEVLISRSRASMKYLQAFQENWNWMSDEQKSMFCDGDMNAAYQHCVNHYLEISEKTIVVQTRRKYLVL